MGSYGSRGPIKARSVSDGIGTSLGVAPHVASDPPRPHTSPERKRWDLPWHPIPRLTPRAFMGAGIPQGLSGRLHFGEVHPQTLELLVERGSVDPQRPCGGVPAPAVPLQSLDDQPSLRIGH
jgi:hypothetical protein